MLAQQVASDLEFEGKVQSETVFRDSGPWPGKCVSLCHKEDNKIHIQHCCI